jgi:hypothetical protein
MPVMVLRDVGVSTIAKHQEVIIAGVTDGIATWIFETLKWPSETSSYTMNRNLPGSGVPKISSLVFWYCFLVTHP